MSSSTDISLQSVILKLQTFWADQGCLIWQPYHTEVGAGTMNPATLLRVLGPEPWWVAYVEPSFRPADGRYGENPNRWQHYYQFQVILKPDPGDPQERYLDSLVALGIDPQQHDIRFVEDNWEAPTVGAWGLGWEVWLDGQEITQYTYFQQAGGRALDPVSVEITYGLERILLALQGVDSFLDLQWDERLTYGEIMLRPEVEYCTYNFETAEVERLRGMFEAYEAEAKRAIERGLVQPAYDYVLKCSHTFNLMDARGAVGVTERAALFGRMRDLAEQVAVAYEEQRAEAGHPIAGRWDLPALEAELPEPGSPPNGAAPFLLEIGVEELPPADLEGALEQLEEAVPAALKTDRLEHGDIHVYGTPRRLVVVVEGLAPAQAEEISRVKGPPAERAFDDDGNPTEAAEGFVRSKGVGVGDLQVEEMDGGRYVFLETREAGRAASEVLTERLPRIIADLTFGRAMRWNSSGVSFSRPIRWLLALHGDHLVPFQYAGLSAGRQSRGLRFGPSSRFEVDDLDSYDKTMVELGILLDPSVRRRDIQGQVAGLAEEVGGTPVDEGTLLSEVTHLVEVPTAFRGEFDESFLELPRPVLISVMREHQRYFAVEKGGGLLPYFVGVRNGGDEHLETVVTGNEQVIQARFADAAFFVERDRQRALEDYLPELESRTFESSLGSMRAKVSRVERLTALLAERFSLSVEEAAVAQRAAHLSKADLATEMVVEMTSLQGHMGRIYALEGGEEEGVALAIAEHYLPRFSGDQLPESRPGLVVSLADRLDSLMGLFAAGMEPTGGGDPFALRRAAIGLIEILVGYEQAFDLRWALEEARDALPIEASDERLSACLEFIQRRHQNLLLAEGHRHDAVEAVLAEQGHDPAAAARGVVELEEWMGRPDWEELLDNYARCLRITRDLEEVFAVDPERLAEGASRALYEHLEEAEGAGQPDSVDDFMRAFQPLVPAIQRFFDEVLVMVEDEGLRENRLGLLQRIAGLAHGAVDLTRVEGF